MIKQTLFFSTPVRLSLKNCQLVISWKDSDDVVTRPIEDIGCVILENLQTSISLPLLNELVKNNVAVILCDNKQMPTAMLQPLDANTTQAESIKSQLAVSDPMKKQVWKQIIEAKIKNQSLLLTKLGLNGAALKPLYMAVRNGDTDNREGIAAKVYWNLLFGGNFKREREGPVPNAMLNYGYSILRAATARALLGSGLLPNLGVFHKSRYNAFPLADDVMEPYRPYVDEIVYQLFRDGHHEVNKTTKELILRVLNCDVKIGSKTRPLQVALTFTSASLMKYYSLEAKKLTLPEVT